MFTVLQLSVALSGAGKISGIMVGFIIVLNAPKTARDIIYLFKINDRRIRGPLILSDVHKNTKIAQYDKLQKREKNKQSCNLPSR